MSGGAFQQTYRNRAEAWEKFFEGQRLPVSRAKWYDDAKRLKLVQLDKSVHLGDLLAYVSSELGINLVTGEGTGQSLAEREADRERADLELRKLRAEVAAKEKSDRREDEKWLEVAEHEIQMAAFAGRLEEALKQTTALKLPELLHRVGAEARRSAELAAALEELYAEAFTEAVKLTRQLVAFEAEEAA
jgi:hypothetical protein